MDDYGNSYEGAMLSEQDKKDFLELVAIAVSDTLDRRDRIDHETHVRHHAMWEDELLRRERRAEYFIYVRNVATGFLVVSGIGVLLTGLAWLGKLVISAVSIGNLPGG